MDMPSKKKSSTFPLLSLPNDLCENILSYLDEENLLPLDHLSITTTAIPSIVQLNNTVLRHWNLLDRYRAADQASSALFDSPRERGIRFAKAASYARKMEHWAAIPYAFRNGGDYDEPDTFYTLEDYRRDLCNVIDFKEGDDAPPPPPVELFIRMTYQNDDGTSTTLVEGFRSNFRSGVQDAALIQNNESRTEAIVATDSCLWVECNDFRKLGDQTGVIWEAGYEDEDDLLRWPEAARKDFLAKTSLTIVACPAASSTEQLLLVLATKGHHAPLRDMAMFPPRSTLAGMGTVVSMSNCVTAGISLFEPNSPLANGLHGYRILLNWGNYFYI